MTSNNTLTKESKTMNEATKKAGGNDLKVNDILCSCWGYDQTNWDFYQVIKTTPRQVMLRKLNVEKKEVALEMRGTITPIKNSFADDETLRRKVRTHYDSDVYNEVDIESYASASPWNGEPKTFTSYA